MLSLRLLFLAGLMSATLAGPFAWGAEIQPFSPTGFAAAQKAGKSILVDVHAPWCPVCRAQAPILAALLESEPYAGFVAYAVDFDNDNASLQRFAVIKQSTLIVFKGPAEVARSVGESSREAITSLLNKAAPGERK